MSSNNLTAKQLEDLLTTMGQFMTEQQRQAMVQNLIDIRAAEANSVKINRYDPMMGHFSSVVASSYDPMTDRGSAINAPTLNQFTSEYVSGMDAAKVVLEFLTAQFGMDLFSGNDRAKRLYERVVIAGINEVFYNNQRWE